MSKKCQKKPTTVAFYTDGCSSYTSSHNQAHKVNAHVLISTEVALSNLRSTTPAANINLAHISSRIRRLPYLAMENGFTVQPNVIHDCVVAVGAQRFLVSGHYSVEAPINGALNEVAPTFDWKGEIIVVQLGKKVNYLSQMQSPLAIAATNK
ncbi:hypothetical protein C8J57DRAFT_1250780 [Mycena rebaudengoi]|nr:hypothetical protein C8J57DRAFT_1250780 [Mycena rebaudengoi]